MTNGSKPVLIVITIVVLVVLLALVWAKVAAAQVITTPYNCGSYWSSQPCGYNIHYYGYGYTYPYSYQNSYHYHNYRYPYSYHPYNYYAYRYPAPTCTLMSNYANTSYYSYYGYYPQPITLSWTSTNATYGYISPNVGSVSAFGMQVVYPNGNTTYTMTIYGPGGSNTCQTTYYAPYYQPYWYPYGNYQYY
ncbi:MAG TPA: hypothetical protein VMU27_02050 [Candidatus Paceibacterota bacterium]|nr:hypothetical protein [Candidatus Paceibacterota bacterium]